MKKTHALLLLCAGLACTVAGCTSSGISADSQRQLETVLDDSPRADSLRTLLKETPRDEQEAMAYSVLDVLEGKAEAFDYTGHPVFDGFGFERE